MTNQILAVRTERWCAKHGNPALGPLRCMEGGYGTGPCEIVNAVLLVLALSDND